MSILAIVDVANLPTYDTISEFMMQSACLSTGDGGDMRW